jgi:hypothetical protein
MDTVISSQPMTCEVMASRSSQPNAGQAGPSRYSCSASAATAEATVAPAVASNSTAATAGRWPGGRWPADDVACRSVRM